MRTPRGFILGLIIFAAVNATALIPPPCHLTRLLWRQSLSLGPAGKLFRETAVMRACTEACDEAQFAEAP